MGNTAIVGASIFRTGILFRKVPSHDIPIVTITSPKNPFSLIKAPKITPDAKARSLETAACSADLPSGNLPSRNNRTNRVFGLKLLEAHFVGMPSKTTKYLISTRKVRLVAIL